ncbi:MAG: transglutaminase-like domain-containing protein [Gammaproteobacteria bacterium]
MDEFCSKTRRGFCEHYAGSFAFLMRAAGIPARVILGYQGANMCGDYLIVRQSDAHAWVEVWLDEQGSWTRIDPTAAVAPVRGNKMSMRLQKVQINCLLWLDVSCFGYVMLLCTGI